MRNSHAVGRFPFKAHSPVIALSILAAWTPACGDDAAPHDSDAAETSDASPADSAQDPEPLCTLWRTHRSDRTEGVWTGDLATCDPGESLAPGPEHTLEQVNLVRILAGLPPVTLSPEKNVAAQHCALIMHANRQIEHEVPPNWACYEPLGAATAQKSNLATTAGVFAVDLYMADNGVPNLGHRRWILSNTLGPIGAGSTSGYSCLHVLGGEGDAGARWTAWPPAGRIPVQILRAGQGMDLDTAGWSVQSDLLNFTNATVRVTRDGTDELPVQVDLPGEGYGSNYAIRFIPDGWRTQVGHTYEVEITLARETIRYSVTPIQCR